ncbi:MAG: hypothetical protein H6573_29765 [Lewinellaceae bacterium]|nr:hypothetical protein [Phaeodactylibacter sp.]MCB9351655.1 hypothetical protein [Lewinellaceae bacterium]
MTSILARINCALAFLLASCFVSAQSDALIFKPLDSDEEPASPTAYKQEVAQKVYEHLVAARGDNRFNAPTFELVGTESNGAKIYYLENRIILEEKAYNVCTQLGADSINALATLLAHELTHFYEKHGWTSKFSSSFAGLEIGDTLGKLSTKIINETQADYLGGFLAYSAGYDVFNKGAEFMADLYKTYDLKESVEGYPSLSDRRAMSRSSAEKVEELASVFDVANLMAITANSALEYQMAQLLYEYILNDYQSRELYNNLGVLATYEALTYFSENEVKYRFPLQLELELKSARGGDGIIEKREALLLKAVHYFDYAIGMDASYAPAFLNKACALTLLKDYGRARFYAETEAMAKAGSDDTYMAGSVAVLLGIIAGREGKTREAEKYFDNAIALGSSLGTYNRKVLRGEDTGREEVLSFSLDQTEEIDGVDLLTFTRRPKGKQKIALSVTPKLNFFGFLLADNPDNSMVMILESKIESSSRPAYYLYQLTGKDYAGKTRKGIQVGTDRKEVAVQYGEPESTLQSTSGEILKYKNILFFLGPDKKVRKWAAVEK